MTSTKEVRVRIAPSPTGYFHVGTARTALFNWLFAKQHNGKFILRIEDTDIERSDKKYEADIINSLKWLGLDFDEGPYYQSKRLDIYQKYIEELIDKEIVYHCFCSKDELEAKRQAQLAQGIPPRYTGKCRDLNHDQVRAELERNTPFVLRLKVPETIISFKDMIRDEIKFDAGLIGDIVIAKDTRTPLYNLAVVIDDSEMGITHVIRGEDHIANTPKQIIIQQALCFIRPRYAHLPLILDPDRSKMSKRYAATAISEYQKTGYLAEAFLNFLLLLGWHPAPDADGREQEIFSRDEMIKSFDINRVQKGGAVFNLKKLDWLNSQYLKKTSNENLTNLLNLDKNEANLKIVALAKERMVTLNDFNEVTGFFYKLPDYPEDLLIWQNSSKEKALKILQNIAKIGEKINADKINQLAEKEGKGDVFWPLRVALSGLKASPGPLEILDILEKKESLARINIAIAKLKGN